MLSRAISAQTRGRKSVPLLRGEVALALENHVDPKSLVSRLIRDYPESAIDKGILPDAIKTVVYEPCKHYAPMLARKRHRYRPNT
jgi:hypothetical protein